jgi:transcription initiation factor TFIIE subunit alpha
VVRGFYSIEDALIVDMMVRYPCMREDDLCNLLKFDRKTLRAKISGLRSDKFLQVKPRIETNEDNKVVKMNCYFINYKVIRTFLLTSF